MAAATRPRISEAMEDQKQQPAEPEMETRRITLADGRYMVFYTFDGAENDREAAAPPARENGREENV